MDGRIGPRRKGTLDAVGTLCVARGGSLLDDSLGGGNRTFWRQFEAPGTQVLDRGDQWR